MLSFDVMFKCSLVRKLHLANLTLVRLVAFVDFFNVSGYIRPIEFLAHWALVWFELHMNILDVVLQLSLVLKGFSTL